MAPAGSRQAWIAVALVGGLLAATASADHPVELPPLPRCAGLGVAPGEVCAEADAALASAERNLEVAEALANGALESVDYQLAPVDAALTPLGCASPGWVWTSRTDGAGSCLDADRLDGLDSAQLLRSDRDGLLRGELLVGPGAASGQGAGGADHEEPNDPTGTTEQGVLLDGVDGRGQARIELRTPGGAPYVDFSATLEQDFGARLGYNASGAALEVHGAGLAAEGPLAARAGTPAASLVVPVAAAEGRALEPGEVVVLAGFDPSVGRVRAARSAAALDPGVLGVVAWAPGVRLGGAAADVPVAVAGFTPVKVHGPVRAGDLLVASAEPGLAMACPAAGACAGAVLGKAVIPHPGAGEGVVLALLALG